MFDASLFLSMFHRFTPQNINARLFRPRGTWIRSAGTQLTGRTGRGSTGVLIEARLTGRAHASEFPSGSAVSTASWAIWQSQKLEIPTGGRQP